MSKPMKGLLIISAFLILAIPARPGSREFEISYTIELGKSWEGPVKVWVPYPVEENGQKVKRGMADSTLGHELRSEPVFGNRYFYFSGVVTAGSDTRINVRYEVERSGLKFPAKADPDLKPQELSAYRRPSSRAPTEAVWWLTAEITGGVGTPVQRARSIYEYVLKNMAYDKTGEGWGNGDLSYCLTQKKGNCTDFHSLFNSIALAADLPARFEIGFALPTDRKSGKLGGYHCWTGVHIEGSGWLPMDISETWKKINAGKGAVEDYFGVLDENRVSMSRGRDIVLDPPPKSGALNYFVFPLVEINGIEVKSYSTTVEFRDLK